ncbi:MAG TPA: TonB-dependent receptor [Roseomonas sp.]|jgi:outer membrane receptor protein involved in Fe transport
MRRASLVILGLSAAAPAAAQQVLRAPGPEITLPEIAVEASRAEAARQSIAPSLGASEYRLEGAAIQALPGGPATQLNQILLQAPGVVQDSYGDIHVRGEHRNLQFRLNGITLPEGLSGFGQVFDGLALRSVSLIDGALPAQYGLRTNAVIDMQTRSGALDPGGSIGFTGGSHGTWQPYGSWAGNVGGWDVFAAGSYLRNELGVENPARTREAQNDTTQQFRGILSLSRQLTQDTRLSFVGGAALNRFEIPTQPGQPTGFTAFGSDAFPSQDLRAHQWERSWFGTAALQHSFGWGDAQIAAFVRSSTIHYVPDTVGELRFNGTAADVMRRSVTIGTQGDVSWRVSDAHTIRAGFVVSGERSSFANQAMTLPVDDSGAAIDAPFLIDDRGARTGWTYGAYVQDEWRVSQQVTLNFGLRADYIDQYTQAGDLSPRVNLVYTPAPGTRLHIGYAHSFTPPEQELVATPSLQRFVGTTNAPNGLVNDTPRPERAHRFDAGITQEFGEHLTLGVNVYYKHVTDLLDLGQFGNALVFTPFNYRRGRIYGSEFSATWRSDDLLLYGNLALSRSVAQDIRSGQFNFDSDEFAYIRDNLVRTDHDQLITASAGAVWRAWQDGRVSASVLFGSGLRAGFANTERLKPHTSVNLGVQQDFRLPDGGTWTARLDILNVFDQVYELRDGTGIGVGAPQYGTRRGFFLGLSRAF